MMQPGKNNQGHAPVMLERCVALLTPAIERVANPIVVDATLGLGGHSEALLTRFPNLRIIGFDRDQEAIARSSVRLAQFSNRLNIIHATYDALPESLKGLGIDQVDGILFDLGVSSMQLDNAERGFAYSKPAPLDMRMDQSSGLTASEILSSYSKTELVQILREYGEERFASKIADNIIRARSKGGISDTAELAELVRDSIPAPARRIGGHPAKRTFQALRIEVNRELEILGRAIPAALTLLCVGGRMVVLSFHSLEDKIVKRNFVAVTESKTPIGLPVEIESMKAKFRLLVSGSESASDAEIEINPRAQSVRLRAIERVAS
jgi:16S rRNA (cytosine1402-N4)-methyltransferase